MAWYVIKRDGNRRVFLPKDKEKALEVYDEDGIEYGFYDTGELFTPYVPLAMKVDQSDMKWLKVREISLTLMLHYAHLWL